MTDTRDVDLPALARWLEDRLGASNVRIDGLARPQGSGFSAETVMFTARCDRYGATEARRLVLRRETPDPPVYPSQVPGVDVEVDIQHRTMAALARCGGGPLAPLLGYGTDGSVLGAPFFVMGFVDGDVPIENPLYTQRGFFVDATPETRRHMIEDGLAVLARIHSVDWRAAGFDWLVPPGVEPGTAQQVAVWEDYARRELGEREHPLLAGGFEWLHGNLPTHRSVGVCWGDARLGNMIWRDGRCVCVTDFEAASIASPEQDLGWWLMFDRWVHETFGVERLDGEPTREEQRALYVVSSGRDVDDTTFHEVFAATRYTAIVVRVMNRAVARGDLPADQTIWLENPGATCLAQLMAEL